MDAELRTKWVAALRSGEYIQGKGALERVVEGGTLHNCCLGVLCRVARIPADGSENPNLHAFGGNLGALSEEVLTKVGLDDGEQRALIALNDALFPGKENTFAGIADWIEENVKYRECNKS